MSYILDALKKSEEERERGAVPKLTTHLITETESKRRMWPWVVGGALLANAAVLGAFLLPSEDPPAGVPQETASETPKAKPTEPTASTETKTATAEPPPANPESQEAKPEPIAEKSEPIKATPEPKAEAPAATTPSAEPAAAEPLPKVIFPPRRPAAPIPVKAEPRSKPPALKEIQVTARTPTPEPTAAAIKSAPEPKPMPPEPAPVVVVPKPEPPKPEQLKAEPKPPAPIPNKTVVAAVPPVKPVPKPKPPAPKKIKSPSPTKISPPAVAKSIDANPSDSGYAVAYYNRGWGYAGKLLFNQAIEDYTQAIRLKKEYADAYFARGWVYEKQDKIDLALKDYTRAIDIKPNHALAYNNRGVLQLHRTLYDEAADDFSTAFTLADKGLRPYVLLWLHLSRIRSGNDGKSELIKYAKKLDLRRWPGVVVSMFLGEASVETVIAGTKDKDPAQQKEKECVAFYFLGQQKLLEGDTDGAKEFFRRTIATGVASYVQYGAAKEELRRMGAS